MKIETERDTVQQALSEQDEHARAEIFRHIELLERENEALREALATPQNQLDDINVADMAAFEAAMRYHGFFTPQRFPPQTVTSIAAQDVYLSARDQDRCSGWKMAMEANGDERELCARVCEDLPAPKDCTAAEASIWDVATMACAAAIRARGVK